MFLQEVNCRLAIFCYKTSMLSVFFFLDHLVKLRIFGFSNHRVLKRSSIDICILAVFVVAVTVFKSAGTFTDLKIAQIKIVLDKLLQLFDNFHVYCFQHLGD